MLFWAVAFFKFSFLDFLPFCKSAGLQRISAGDLDFKIKSDCSVLKTFPSDPKKAAELADPSSR